MIQDNSEKGEKRRGPMNPLDEEAVGI